MLLYQTNILYDDLYQNEQNEQNEQNKTNTKKERLYQARFEVHQRNACTRVKDTELIYDAIQLAQQKDLNRWTWQYDQAENHPAILKLCAFWECFQDFQEYRDDRKDQNIHQSIHEARIPYLQLFLGNSEYLPIIPDAARIPLLLKHEELQKTLKTASVIFGEKFLVTYLAGRYFSAKRAEHNYLVHYTVHKKPFLKERLLFSERNPIVFDLQNQLAYQTLNALHDFPKNFPTLWQQLKKHEEQNKRNKANQGGLSYEIH